MAEDLYSTLGLGKGANDADIKAAYRRLAKEWHPDKHKGDKQAEEKFKKINVAYEVLSDQKKRQQYDHFGAAGGGGGFPGGGAGFKDFGFDFSNFSSGGASDFADIFETFFGGGARSKAKRGNSALRGRDIEVHIKLSFEEAVFGCEKGLEIAKLDMCDHCSGKGAEPDTPIVSCRQCEGTGEIRAVRNTILGQVTTSQICNECGGEGRIPEKKCPVCHGATRVRVKKRVKAKIPAGVDNGSTIRLSGRGEGGLKGGPSGDIFIILQVEPSKKFIRSGFDIHSVIEIPLLQAVLGAEIEVETIDGVAKIKIPAGTQDGKVFKLTSKGVPRIKTGGRGDHLVKIKIKIPEKLSRKEKELYNKLAEEGGIDVKKGGLF